MERKTEWFFSPSLFLSGRFFKSLQFFCHSITTKKYVFRKKMAKK